MNKAQLVRDLKNMIGPAGRGSEVDDTGLTYWINEAYMIAVSKIVENVPDYFTKEVTTSSVNGQREYVLPDDFEKIIMASISYDGATYVRALPLNNINQATPVTNTNDSNFNIGQPFYYLSGNEIGFLPTPGTTLTNNIRIWYSAVPSELNDDADVPSIPIRMQYGLKYWAYANYLDQNDEHVAAERMRQRFDATMDALASQLAINRSAEERTVEVSGGDDWYQVSVI